MACNSTIYTANTTSTSATAGATLPLGNIIRRRGRYIDSAGSSIVVSDIGSSYYLVTVNATFTAPEAGVISLKLQQNGTDVIGALASTTITTADTEVRSLSFTAIVRTFNNNVLDTLTLVNSGLAADYTNIGVTVTRM